MTGAGAMRAMNGEHLRVFAHYVVGRLVILFFMCHPGTLATCDGQAYLLNRYPNRDLVTTEGQMDPRRHLTPRDLSDFAMKTGVPDEVLNGDADNWTPEWAPSLEERFQRTVMAWLRGARGKESRAFAEEDTKIPELAFVPTVQARGVMDIHMARANDWQKRRWMSLTELPSAKRVCRDFSAPAGRHGCGHLYRPSDAGLHMLLGLRSRPFPFRRRVPGTPGSSTSDSFNADGKLGVDDVLHEEVSEAREMEIAVVRPLEDPELYSTASEGLLSSLLGGAADAYDSAMSFVGCALVTSPLGKRYLNAYDNHNTVPASAIRRGGVDPVVSGSAYDLVGFANIDPLEASGRRGGENSKW